MAWEMIFKHKHEKYRNREFVVSDANEDDIEITITNSDGEDSYYLKRPDVLVLIEALTKWSEARGQA